jgi:gliding motility-associated-like protein
VPTAFSPNGDGFNDRFGARALFVVKGNAIPKKSFLLEIYNRWGQLVFRSNHPDMEWDGTFMGAQCPDGAYVYRVKAVGFDGILHVQEGSVMLIR